MINRFYADLKTAQVEKDVENKYRTYLENYINKTTEAKITSPYSCDGLLEFDGNTVLMEFKYDVKLTDRLTLSKVIAQLVYYVKRMETNGDKLPDALFIGDINECVVLPTSVVTKYLSANYDWNIAPSNAGNNTALVLALTGDADIKPFVHVVDENFHVQEIVENFRNCKSGNTKVKITPANFRVSFDNFMLKVFYSNKTLSPVDCVNLFIQIIVNGDENYVHPKKKNVLITKSFGELKIDGTAFDSFVEYYMTEGYTPSEKEKFTAISDSIIQDEYRRRNGEFYTPKAFVDEAHEYIDEALGSNWKDEYIVWDCACGTGNLTRDYRFKELYMSTLEKSDIATIEQMKYNPEAVKFQFDFLNDSDDKLPEGLQKALKDGKKILFLINPPYGTANNAGTDNSHKEGIAKTKINELMLSDNMKRASLQLYSQFLYRIMKYNTNNNINISLYSPSLYKTGGSFDKFRKAFYNTFKFVDGFLFGSEHFDNTATRWAVDFSVWTSGKTECDIMMDVLDTDKVGKIIKTGTKDIYNLDSVTACSDWVRKYPDNLEVLETPYLSSATKVKEKGYNNIYKGSFACLSNKSNSVYDNSTGVSLLSSTYSNCGLVSVMESNFDRVVTLFTARKSIKATWLNQKDEYIAPNEAHPDWQSFVNDSLVYSLFNNSSEQSSLRNVTYKGKNWNIYNHFFFMSKDEMKELAEKHNYDEMYRDVKTDKDRYVYNKLSTITLSKEAQTVLDMAKELVRKSMDARKAYSQSNPDDHLDAWDAGYSQLKVVWKEFYKEDFDKFRKAYKALEDKLIPQVYELGFLRK